MTSLRAICIAILLTLGMYSCDMSIKSPPEALKIYPNAQDIQRSIEGLGQEITFYTVDTSDEVFLYYEQVLVQQRWILLQKFPKMRKFVYRADASEGYNLTVFITEVRDGKTYVSIIQRGVNPAIIPIDEG